MDHSLLFINHFPHARAAERAEIERLPTRSGIERRAIQNHAKSAGPGFNHARAKLAHVTVGVIKTIRGHFDVIEMGK